MTLKCKIKEVSELKTDQELEKYTVDLLTKDDSDSEPELIEDTIAEEDFDLQELGTIEEMSF